MRERGLSARARACQTLGVDVKETRYLGDDATAWIISHNVHRRHLTESQRAMIAARLANLSEGRPAEETQSIDRVSSVRQADAAAALNVGTASVGRARAVVKSGDVDLIRSVDAGETSVSKAAEQVRARDKRVHVAASERVQQITELARRRAHAHRQEPRRRQRRRPRHLGRDCRHAPTDVSCELPGHLPGTTGVSR